MILDFLAQCFYHAIVSTLNILSFKDYTVLFVDRSNKITYPHIKSFIKRFFKLLLTQALWRHIIGVASE